MNPFRGLHKFYRAVYRVNRASRTASAFGSGSPKRIVKLYARRASYRFFARLMNRLFR